MYFPCLSTGCMVLSSGIFSPRTSRNTTFFVGINPPANFVLPKQSFTNYQLSLESNMFTSHAAPVKWAQRKGSLYLTIPLSNLKDAGFNFTEKTLTFTGSSNGQLYSLQLEFFKEIESEASLWKILPLSAQVKLFKKNKTDPFWPRLLLDKAQERTNITVDWERYVDEEDNPMDFCTRHLQDNIEGFAGEAIAPRPAGGGGRCPFGGDAGSFSDDEMRFSDFETDSVDGAGDEDD